MSNSIFSTADRFTSHFKLVDSLINSVAERLLPRHEAKGDGCYPGEYVCDSACLTWSLCGPSSYTGYVGCCNSTGVIVDGYEYCGC